MAKNFDNTPRLALPVWLYVPGLVALLFLSWPVVALLSRVPWSQLGAQISSEEGQAGLWLSLSTCLISTVICVVIGVPAALILARMRRGDGLVRALVLLPMTLPPVVAGIALLSAFGRRSLLGGWLDDHGMSIGFSPTAVVFAQVFVSLPFLVVSVEGAAKSLNPRLQQAAMALGARPAQIFWKITLAQLLPALGAGTALSFARALGEFGATLTFAGSLRGVTRTLPLAIYLLREEDTDLSLSLAAVLMMIALVLVGFAALLTRMSQVSRVHEEPAAAAGESPENAPAQGSDSKPAENPGETLVSPLTPHETPGDTDSATKKNELAPHETASDSATPGQTDQADPTAPPSLHVNATVNGRFTGELELAGGRTLAVIGPNGAGKSTLLRTIMGFEPSATGSVMLGANTLVDTDSGVRVKPWRRHIGLLTQSADLFPHMSALDDVVFGLRAAKVPRHEARAQAWKMLKSLGVEHLARRYPTTLSGGQAARVALARTLAVKPQLVMLDEPFAALDVQSAEQLRELLRRELSGVTTMLVTHSRPDVEILADDVLTIENGHISQPVTPTTEVLANPRTAFLADFVGKSVANVTEVALH